MMDSQISTRLLPLSLFDASLLETKAVFRKTAGAARWLAELKGASASIPNQGILINTLALQEAKDSSEIENIVTTHDELFKDNLFPDFGDSSAAKEVRHYVQALRVGFEKVKADGLLTNNHILQIHAELEANTAGFRRLPGTSLKNNAGDIVYTPPQDPGVIIDLMTDLERFINDDSAFDADPLVKMALLHHQFESIHPFYDGNGRTGRILAVLYLVQQGLLDSPVLYLSRHIVRTKPDYYRLLQGAREQDDWENWVLYMLTAVEETARQSIGTVGEIKEALQDYKRRIRARFRFYSQDLINTLFANPYTKIEFVERDLQVSRPTATKYLEDLTGGGFLQKHRAGRSNYYINRALYGILTRTEP